MLKFKMVYTTHWSGLVWGGKWGSGDVVGNVGLPVRTTQK